MSTIETNTEELQEILQQVYDLPDRNAGGSSKPDLILYPNDNYDTYNGPTESTVSYDQAKVISVYQKALSGQDASVTISGRIAFNSGYRYNDRVVHRSYMIIANEATSSLSVLFPGFIWGYNSVGGASLRVYEVVFKVDAENRTAYIDYCDSREIGNY